MLVKESIDFRRGISSNQALNIGYNQLKFILTPEIQIWMRVNEEEDSNGDLTSPMWTAAIEKEIPDQQFTFIGGFSLFNYEFPNSTISKSVLFILKHPDVLKSGILIPPKDSVPYWYEDELTAGTLQLPYNLYSPGVIMASYGEEYAEDEFNLYIENSLITYI